MIILIIKIKLALQWAEYISIASALVFLLISSFTSADFNSLLFLSIILALIFNVVNNRLLLRKYPPNIAQEIDSIEQKITELQQKILKDNLATINGELSLSENQEIASLQESVESLHQSLVTVINFLKKNKLDLRIKNLETLYQSLQSSENYLKIQNKKSSFKIKLPDQNILKKPTFEELNLNFPEKIAWKCIHVITAHQESVTSLAMTIDQKYLLSTSWDNYLKLWSLTQGSEISQIRASEEGITSLALNSKNYLDRGILTGDLNQNIKVWSLDQQSQSFSLEETLSEHTGSIHGLEIASKRNIVVSGSFDQSLKQWDLSTGNLLYDLKSENGSINAIAINESISLIVTAGDDGVISMWELESENKVGLLLGNTSPIECLVISQSGELIIAGGADGSIIMWQLPTTTWSIFLEIVPYLQLSAHNGQVMDLLLSNDEQLLYSAGIDGYIKIWHLASSKEIGHLKISDND